MALGGDRYSTPMRVLKWGYAGTRICRLRTGTTQVNSATCLRAYYVTCLRAYYAMSGTHVLYRSNAPTTLIRRVRCCCAVGHNHAHVPGTLIPVLSVAAPALAAGTGTSIAYYRTSPSSSVGVSICLRHHYGMPGTHIASPAVHSTDCRPSIWETTASSELSYPHLQVSGTEVEGSVAVARMAKVKSAICYAVPGTELAHGAVCMDVLCDVRSPLSSYAPAMRCPVLMHAMLLPDSRGATRYTSLRAS
eukprot:3769153-Rhodomonas_salina.4